MKYAEPKDVNYCIQILKLAKDRLKINQSYAERKIVPSIDRIILELEDMLK